MRELPGRRGAVLPARARCATYNGKEYDGEPTFGGYSTSVVVDENYVLGIPEGIGLDEAAPLLCAGITLYSPLQHWGAGPGTKVAIVGMGGLGHMGVKIAARARRRGDRAQPDAVQGGGRQAARRRPLLRHQRREDLRGARRQLRPDRQHGRGQPAGRRATSSLLRLDGTMVNVGIPDEPGHVPRRSRWPAMRRRMAGSKIGGIRETQEMLDFCAEHGLGAEIETIGVDDVERRLGPGGGQRRALPVRHRRLDVLTDRSTPTPTGQAQIGPTGG